jgi:DNA polymerase III delta subunit
MAEKKPSRRSPRRSSPAPSKAGDDVPRDVPRSAPRGSSRLDEAALVARFERDDFPASLYLDGPDESLKAALIAEARHAWARACPESPQPRVFRAAEDSVEEILAAYQGTSLFTPRELILVLDVEGLGRSERSIRALAEAVRRPAGGSCLIFSESASDSSRKALEPLRAACAVRLTAFPLARRALIAWGRRRVTREGVTVEEGLLETMADACENDPSEFFNELEKLLTCVGPSREITRAEAAQLLRPVADADRVDFLAAVAAGDPSLAGRRLAKVLAAGESEGAILFALANLVGGAIGGWSRWRDLSMALSRRSAPADLARALDALYRAEAAWKGGRADAITVLEQVTREISTPSAAAARR